MHTQTAYWRAPCEAVVRSDVQAEGRADRRGGRAASMWVRTFDVEALCFVCFQFAMRDTAVLPAALVPLLLHALSLIKGECPDRDLDSVGGGVS